MPIERKDFKEEKRSKIQSFMSTFDKNVARPNLFHVVMNPPVHIHGHPRATNYETVGYRGTAFNGAASDEFCNAAYECSEGTNDTTRNNLLDYATEAQLKVMIDDIKSWIVEDDVLTKEE